MGNMGERISRDRKGDRRKTTKEEVATEREECEHTYGFTKVGGGVVWLRVYDESAKQAIRALHAVMRVPGVRADRLQGREERGTGSGENEEEEGTA